MIRICIPGFQNSDSGGPRWGDAQIIDDGKNYEVIDGYCGVGATRPDQISQGSRNQISVSAYQSRTL